VKEKSRILKKVDDDRSRPVSFNDSFGGGDNQLRFLLKYLPDESFKDINLILNSTNHDLIEKDKINVLWVHHFVNQKEIQNLNTNSRIIMLTGYGNISTAVAAIKQGAIDYLAKPADADDVEKALLADPNKKAQPPENPMSADRVKWEHIHRVFELCNRNVSETARRLKMHRRTLQRILSKKSPR